MPARMPAHVPAVYVRKGIDGDLRRLPDGHAGQLRFLIVRNDPHLRQRREGRDLASHTHQLSRFDLTLSDDPVLGRGDRGVAEIDSRCIECGALRGDGRLALCELRFKNCQLALAARACARLCLSCASV